MKNLKNRKEFKSVNESRELSVKELEAGNLEPNWKFARDFVVDGETRPMVYKGTSVYYDAPGERLIQLGGKHDGMIVDMDINQLEQYATKIYSDKSFSNESFPVYKVIIIDGEKGDASKLDKYVSEFHEIFADAINDEEGFIYYSKEWLNKEGTSAKKFRQYVEEEAKRLDLRINVTIARMFGDGTGDAKEV